MRLIANYKGYSAVFYGHSSVSVYDPNQHEIMHSGSTNLEKIREKGYERWLADYVERWLPMMAKVFEGETE